MAPTLFRETCSVELMTSMTSNSAAAIPENDAGTGRTVGRKSDTAQARRERAAVSKGRPSDAGSSSDEPEASSSDEPEAASSAERQMRPFDYSGPAELFLTRSRKSKPRPVGYRRFVRAADAIRFAIEDVPSELLLGSYLEVETARFDSKGIRRLYDGAAYPLPRRAARSIR